ncbi:methylenetetrahydrofolate reductase [Nanoarchaeota archaeon]
MPLKDKLESGKFIITAEIEPPKGTDIEIALEKAKMLHEAGVDAINVTDNQRAVMRLAPIGLCKVLIDNNIEAVWQITCRDRNKLALQADALAANLLGIKSCLVLGGDPPKFGDHPDAKPVYDLHTVQLIETLTKLNNGKDLAEKELNKPTDLFIAAAANPGAEDLDEEKSKLKAKLDAGAHFFQTQAVYDVEHYKEFYEKVKDLNPKILVGIIPLKSAKMARFMNEKVPGINVPEELIKEIEASENPMKTGVEQAIKIIKELKASDLCSGVHIMALGAEKNIPEIMSRVQ